MRALKAILLINILVLSFCVHSNENIEILSKLPLIENLQISPNGEKIAYMQNIDGSYHIVTKSIGKVGTKPDAFTMEKAKIRNFEWGNDNRIIFIATIPYYSRGDFETFTVYRMGILDTDTNKSMWPFNKGNNAYFVGSPQVVNKLQTEPNHILVHYAGKVSKVDLTDGDKDFYFREYNFDEFHSNKKGDPLLYRVYSRKLEQRLTMFKLPDEEDYKQLKEKKDDKEDYFDEEILGFTDTDTEFYFYKRNKNKVLEIYLAKIEDNLVVSSELVSNTKNLDVDDVIYDLHSSQIIGYKYIKDYPEYHYFNKKLASVHADLKYTFPDAEVEITSYSIDKNRFIAKVSGQNNPLEYFFYDKKKAQLAKIGSGYPGLNLKEIGKVSRMDYKTSDGLMIASYLTKPEDKTEKLPLIVIPHGGPESRDDMSFYWMRHFFASEGYAVFQPNFRGSSGYGKKFAKAGYGEWGKKMQSDIDEGVKKLIHDGIIDPERICVVGGSYGGYVAFYSATVKHSLYKCAVSFGGVSSLDAMYYHQTEQKGSLDYFEKSIGDRKDRENLRKHSPLLLVSKKTRPILIFHGEKDTVVPPFQSENMYKALKKSKISGSKYIELEGEDHWFTLQESRKIFLKESIKFIKDNI